MNEKTILNINRFGKVGKIVMTVLLIAAIVFTILMCISAIYASSLPKDTLKVNVTSNAEFEIKESSFAAVWSMLTKSASYADDKDPSSMLKDNNSKIIPSENTEIKTDLNFFNQSYSSAKITSEGSKKIIEAKSSPSEYRSSDLITLLILAALFSASMSVALFMLRNLFKEISVCESPFSNNFVSKLRSFGYSLLPVAIFATIGETFAVRFLFAGRNSYISVQWGILVAFAITMCLVALFRYGVQLQKESDETL